MRTGEMMKRALAALSLLLVVLGAPVAVAREASAPSMQGPWDMIVFDLKSWGRPIGYWIITPDGGSWMEFTTKEGAPPPNEFRVVHEIEAAGGNRFRDLSALVARIPTPAPTSDGCHDFMTDLPYGTIRLTRGATTIEIAFNSGCRDAAYVAFLDVLQKANELVAGWGKPGKVLRSEILQR
jgi:hypothetical protein